MKALVLALSRGTELKPLTVTMPKALLPVGNVPVIVHNILKLRAAGFDEIGVVIGYLGHRIRGCLGSGEALGVRLSYLPVQSRWQEIILPFSDESLPVMQGEWITDTNVQTFSKNLGKNVMLGKMGTGGLYAVTPEAIAKFPENADFETAFLHTGPEVIAWQGKSNRLLNFSDYIAANRLGRVILGKDTGVDSKAAVEGNSVIGNRVTVGSGCVIKNSIIMEDAHIGQDCEIENAIIGRGALIKSGTFVFDYGIVGEGAKIGRNVFIKAQSKVPPFKIIADETTLNSEETVATLSAVSVWNGEITGSVFGEITAAFAVKCGKSLVALSCSEDKIGVGWDGSSQSLPLYYGYLSGLLGSGGNVVNFGVQKYPAFHFLTRQHAPEWSVYIASDKGECTLRFLDKAGAVPSVCRQKQLEMALMRNEGEALCGIRYRLAAASCDYIGVLKAAAVPSDISVQVECADGFAKAALCMYRQTEPFDICFCLSQRMDKVRIKGLNDRQMQILFSMILNEEGDKEQAAQQLSGDGLFGCVLILNYMQRHRLSAAALREKIPGFFSTVREVAVVNEKREEIVRRLSGGKYGSNVKISRDGGCVVLVPHGKKNAFFVVAEGYNQAFAEDLADFYVRKIDELEEEV